MANEPCPKCHSKKDYGTGSCVACEQIQQAKDLLHHSKVLLNVIERIREEANGLGQHEHETYKEWSEIVEALAASVLSNGVCADRHMKLAEWMGATTNTRKVTA